MRFRRRLYSWLLETDVNNGPVVHVESEEDTASVTQANSIAYDLLNDALKIILKKCSTETPIDIKPYRLLTSLFDKPQIGPVILDNILYDVFRTLYMSCLYQQKTKNNTVRCVCFNGDVGSLKSSDENVLNKQFVMKNCQELVKNANLLFNTLQNYYIWLYIEKLYDESIANIKNFKYRDRLQVNDIGNGSPTILEICILTDFLLDVIPIESYAESTSNILPNLFNKIVKTLELNINIVNQYEITQSLLLCTKILTKIQPTQISNADEGNVSVQNDLVENKASDLAAMVVENGGVEELRTLEKSKSDSKINETLEFHKNELTISDDSRERSYSNQMLMKKKNSPKIDKKSKNKKSKSSSKLYDLKKDEMEALESCSENATPEKLIKESFEQEQSSKPITKIENKFFLTCLEIYKDFYITFIKSKILSNVNIKEYFNNLVFDKNERIKKLKELLTHCLESNDGTQLSCDQLISIDRNNIASECACTDYEGAMMAASNILLEFSAFPNFTTVEKCEKDIDELPEWLRVLIVTACCKESSREIQITAMSTLLEIFSLANNQDLQKNNEANTNIVITGILERYYVNYIEENTTIIEVCNETFAIFVYCIVSLSFPGNVANFMEITWYISQSATDNAMRYVIVPDPQRVRQ